MKIHEKSKEKKKLKLEPGFKQFLWKTGIFVALFVVIQLVTIPLQSILLPEKYAIIRDTDIGKSFLFTIMIFFFLSLEKLKKLERYKFELKTTIILGVLTILTFTGYFIFKAYLGNNPSIALDYLWIFLPLKYIFLILGALFLAIAIFGLKFSRYFIHKFKKEIWISLGTFVLALFLIIQFQKLWIYFSYAVAKSVYFLLNLTFDATINISGNNPSLGLESFVVSIGKPCSGIDSMLMFIFLYVFIVGYDWKVMNKKKAMVVFLPGVISVFILNIIRIYLLMTIGAFVSRGFALGFFHTSASMILFLAYFILFWGLLYKWMKK